MSAATRVELQYENTDTRKVVELVDDASELIRTKGEAAFAELRVADSRWRRGDGYVFVLDLDGKLLVHPDPSLEGSTRRDMKDAGGRPVVEGLIGTATASSSRPTGWYHYEWPVSGAIFPRWKSTYVRLVEAPSGKRYVVASGMFEERMERAFVVDLVERTVELLRKDGEAALAALRDPIGPFVAKGMYVFIVDLDGVARVHPAFPNLEGQNLRELVDTRGRRLIREMIDVVRSQGSGWVDYMWPKPGDSRSTQKSSYVTSAMLGGRPVLVGCGVYLAGAPSEPEPVGKLSARELVTLVREAGALLERKGEAAYAELRTKGSKWFSDSTYFFVWDMAGTEIFHAADPSREGVVRRDLQDILGRPSGKWFLEVGSSPSGEGWVHYMFPEPGHVFPSWKSAFAKRVTLPSGETRIVCSAIYDMRMDEALIEDVVDRAATLIELRGRDAFPELRDKKGPFVFMDTYVFVLGTDGTELVNGAQPGIEGKNVLALRDIGGKPVARDEIAAALKDGRAWTECQWFRPGDNRPSRKKTFVRLVRCGSETFVVGSGIYR